MKTSSVALMLVGMCALLLMNGCRPRCCEDPGMVEIPSSDASAPELIWMVTRATGGPTPTSSIAPHSGETVTITVSRTERVRVFLKARDGQSGIRSVSCTGGFGHVCTRPGSAIVYDGILPTYSQNLTFIRRCGIVEWDLPEYEIDTERGCPVGMSTTSLGYGLEGTAENNRGVVARSSLHIRVEP